MGANQSDGSSISPKSRSVDLTGQMIETFPPIPKENLIQRLILSQNRVKNLPVPLPRLSILNLSGNEISEFNSDMVSAMQTYKKLMILDLSGNHLKDVPKFLWEYRILRTLNVFGNNLESFEFHSSSLEKLNIGQNKLHSIPDLPPTLNALIFDYNFLEKLDWVKPNLQLLSLQLVGLKSISPKLTYPKLETLKLAKNGLTKVPNLRKLAPKLRVLDLSDNLLTEFPHPPNTIEEYRISGNQLAEIPDIIADYHHLYLLDISNNHISSLPELPDTLEELNCIKNQITKTQKSYTPSLKRLYIRENMITSLPRYKSAQIKEISASCNELKEINLSDIYNGATMIDYSFNRLKSIPSDLFLLSHLTGLFLQNNEIKSLPSSISKARALSILHISNNPISELPPMPPSLIYAYVSFCSLKTLNGCFDQCHQLQILHATGNQLTEIPNIPSVKQLYLSRNHFTTFPKNLNPKLNVLDISCNLLTSLPEKFEFPNLEELDLSYNQITNFPKIFNCSKLSYLKLNSNLIETKDVDPNIFNGLKILNIANSGLVLSKEPKARQFFVSEVLPQYETRHVKLITLKPWVSYAEMKGARDTMEDALCVNSLIQKDIDIYAVFDGHSGSKTSTFGSLYLIDIFRSPGAKFTKRYLFITLKKLTKVLRKRNFHDGATMAVALFNGKKVLTGHIGDSRILILNDDGDVKFSTVDHKPSQRSEFERIHNAGGRVENNRIQGILAPGRSLGDFLIPGNSAQPEIHEYEIQPDDRWIIVACDGVFDVLSNEFIGRVAANSTDATSLAFDLRNLAYSSVSLDNITVVVCDIHARNGYLPDVSDTERMVDVTDHDEEFLNVPIDDSQIPGLESSIKSTYSFNINSNFFDFNENEGSQDEGSPLARESSSSPLSSFASTPLVNGPASQLTSELLASNIASNLATSPLVNPTGNFTSGVYSNIKFGPGGGLNSHMYDSTKGFMPSSMPEIISMKFEEEGDVLTKGKEWRYETSYTPNSFFSIRPELQQYDAEYGNLY